MEKQRSVIKEKCHAYGLHFIYKSYLYRCTIYYTSLQICLHIVYLVLCICNKYAVNISHRCETYPPQYKYNMHTRPYSLHVHASLHTK